MAKRTTTATTRKATSGRGRTAAASAPGAQQGSVPVEQVSKSVESSTTARGRTEDVRSSVNMQAITDEMIAARAYEIWAAEGGSDLENWLRAEQELRTQNNQQGQWR